MDDQRFEASLEVALQQRAIAADALLDTGAILRAIDASRHRSRRKAVLLVLGVPVVIGSIVGVTLLASRFSMTPIAGGLGGALAVQSCASAAWPSTPISCSAAQAAVSWGDASIARTRIWLTTLSAVKTVLNPPQQVNEPLPSTAVWMFIYDGRWTCCVVGRLDGSVSGTTDHSRWLYVADATEQGHGFINIIDWSGRPVPDRMPEP